MSVQKEIEDLEKALIESPDNTYLRLVLVKKMRHYEEYGERVEYHLQTIIKENSKNIEAKELLMEHYFNKNNISAAIIIGEEIYMHPELSIQAKLILAKAYLREKNDQKSMELYQQLTIEDPYLRDDELDQAFRIGQSNIDDLEEELGFMSKPKINFSNVGGLDDVKKEIEMKIIKPLEHADLFAQYGKKVGGGILLYGPPGCGKTHLAKATAGEINAGFINVSLHEILDMWIGNSEKNLNEVFEQARGNKPCVLFFDEIDALGAKRSDFRQSAGKNVINQFLAELDGIEADNEGILIIGATNVPWHLDAAFRRPGRFDRIIFVHPPDLEARSIIFKLKLQGKPIKDIDYNKLAKDSNNFSGADIEAVVDIAVEHVLEEAMSTGTPRPLTTKDLVLGIKKHNPTTADWFMTAKNYATFANQSGTYDPVVKYMKQRKML